MAPSATNKQKPLSEAEAKRNREALEQLLDLEENRFCADCSAIRPRWASQSVGVFLCVQCAGVHRSLGVEISFVRSINLDKWRASHVRFMKKHGNVRANRILEYHLSPSEKPNPQSSKHLIEQFIQDKYVRRKFMDTGASKKKSKSKSSHRSHKRRDESPEPLNSSRNKHSRDYHTRHSKSNLSSTATRSHESRERKVKFKNITKKELSKLEAAFVSDPPKRRHSQKKLRETPNRRKETGSASDHNDSEPKEDELGASANSVGKGTEESEKDTPGGNSGDVVDKSIIDAFGGFGFTTDFYPGDGSDPDILTSTTNLDLDAFSKPEVKDAQPSFGVFIDELSPQKEQQPSHPSTAAPDESTVAATKVRGSPAAASTALPESGADDFLFSLPDFSSADVTPEDFLPGLAVSQGQADPQVGSPQSQPQPSAAPSIPTKIPPMNKDSIMSLFHRPKPTQTNSSQPPTHSNYNQNPFLASDGHAQAQAQGQGSSRMFSFSGRAQSSFMSQSSNQQNPVEMQHGTLFSQRQTTQQHHSSSTRYTSPQHDKQGIMRLFHPNSSKTDVPPPRSLPGLFEMNDYMHIAAPDVATGVQF